ncbi:MAG: HEAT repeat domain-containing protein [Clostridiales bacterium]|jgi:hypothetical protein|nr:HEAT repeat domain-containing protein [Clostridiales bacterium]
MNLNELFYEYVMTQRALCDDGDRDCHDHDSDCGHALGFDDGLGEDALSGFYDAWLRTYCGELGQTPADYIGRMRENGTLEDYAEQCFMSGWDLDETVAQYLADETHIPFLTLRLNDSDTKVAVTAAELLAKIGTVGAENVLLDAIISKETEYAVKLVAYEALSESGAHVVDEILKRIYLTDSDTQTMLIEIMSRYRGNKAVYMWLVSLLYRGDEVALAASLLGAYGDEDAVKILNSFAAEYELNANEIMEIRNAVERLGGEFDTSVRVSDGGENEDGEEE